MNTVILIQTHITQPMLNSDMNNRVLLQTRVPQQHKNNGTATGTCHTATWIPWYCSRHLSHSDINIMVMLQTNATQQHEHHGTPTEACRTATWTPWYCYTQVTHWYESHGTATYKSYLSHSNICTILLLDTNGISTLSCHRHTHNGTEH